MIYGEDLLGEVIRAWKVAVTDLTQGKWYGFSGGCILYQPRLSRDSRGYAIDLCAEFTEVVGNQRKLVSWAEAQIGMQEVITHRVRLVDLLTNKMDILFGDLQQEVKDEHEQPVPAPSPEGSRKESKVPQGATAPRGKRPKGG